MDEAVTALDLVRDAYMDTEKRVDYLGIVGEDGWWLISEDGERRIAIVNEFAGDWRGWMWTEYHRDAGAPDGWEDVGQGAFHESEIEDARKLLAEFCEEGHDA